MQQEANAKRLAAQMVQQLSNHRVDTDNRRKSYAVSLGNLKAMLEHASSRTQVHAILSDADVMEDNDGVSSETGSRLSDID